VVECLGHGDHGMLADIVGDHSRGRQQASSGGCVEDAASVWLLKHSWDEIAVRMDDAPHVHSQDPFPVRCRVLPR
jgi:hypothetical protein